MRESLPSRLEDFMAEDNIAWQKDVDAALEQASDAHKPILLDFTAAPA
jgi:hypothetical protein